MEELTINHQYKDNNLLITDFSDKDKDLILNICETIIESSILNEVKLQKYILISNLSIVSNLKDEIFTIQQDDNHIFGISKYKNKDNDYYHIDPINWKKINKNNQKELKIKTVSKDEIIFISTDSKKELTRINNLFRYNHHKLNKFSSHRLGG